MKKGKWVCFPTEKNWNKDTEIMHDSYNFDENGKKTEFFEVFYIHNLGQSFQSPKVAGQVCFYRTCWTRPFCIFKNYDGKYNVLKWKEHPLTTIIEKTLNKK